MIRITLLLATLLSLTGHAAAPKNAADGYPNRPIRLILSNSPGSATDIMGRIAFTRMSDALGQQMVIDNRAGAGGTIGVETGMRAAPDGYTLTTVTLATLAIAPHTYKKIGYDVFKDVQPISVFAIAQTAVCVHAQLPIKSVKELIDFARAQKGKLLNASAGVGTTSHLGGVMFTSMAGIESVHVPYKGGGPSMASVAQGESHWTLGPLVAAMPHVKAGRQRCLATGGEKRSALFPDLPTIAESGVPGFRYYGWNGLIAPVKTPRPIVDKLQSTLAKVLQQPEVRQLYAVQGEEPAWSTPEEFGRMIRDDYNLMGKIVKTAGVKPE